MQNKVVLKTNWCSLCENSWFPCNPLYDSKNEGQPTKSIVSRVLLILEHQTWFQIKD